MLKNPEEPYREHNAETGPKSRKREKRHSCTPCRMNWKTGNDDWRTETRYCATITRRRRA